MGEVATTYYRVERQKDDDTWFVEDSFADLQTAQSFADGFRENEQTVRIVQVVEVIVEQD